MPKSGNLVTVLLVILIVFSLSSTAITYYYFSDEKTRRITLEKQLEETQLTKERLENEIKISEGKITDLNNQLAESKIKIEGLTSQRDIERITKEKTVSERDNLVKDLNQKSTSLQGLTSKLSKAQEEIATLKDQIAKLKPEDELDEEIADAEGAEEIALGTIVVAPGEIPEGEILTVNKEHNFVVINLGEKHGIKPGQTFSVYRKKRFRGDLQVVKVQEDLSIANLLPDTKINSLRKGDRVVAKK